jgi:threonine dehydratase
LGKIGSNILEVDHHRLFLDVPAKGAKLDVTLETRDRGHADEIRRALAADGYQPVPIETGKAIEWAGLGKGQAASYGQPKGAGTSD